MTTTNTHAVSDGTKMTSKRPNRTKPKDSEFRAYTWIENSLKDLVVGHR